MLQQTQVSRVRTKYTEFITELPSFEQCGDDRQTMKECVGKDKEGNDVVFVLERFHVGGQAKERGIAVGGPAAKKPRAKKAA